MIIKSLAIQNYKNIAQASLELSPRINCFTGRNGMGKTNVLDAIYYLSVCRSFNNCPDSLVVTYDQPFMMLRGDYERRGEQEQISCGIQRGKGKTVRRNGKAYRRISEHIGLLPVVMVSPDDQRLISGGTDERRRFIDLIIAQSDADYLNDLIRYNRSLESRNALLRAEVTDHLLYESVEASLAAAATAIFKKRCRWLTDFAPIFSRYYAEISGGAEPVELRLISHLHEAPMAELLDHYRSRDIAMGHTTVGIHRDDLELDLLGHSMRKVGSQGQCKTFTAALRLAQFAFLKRQADITPILLLDDIFDKLDAQRVANIINVVAGTEFGQIFITDTDRTYIDELIARTTGAGDHSSFTVEGGHIEAAL